MSFASMKQVVISVAMGLALVASGCDQRSGAESSSKASDDGAQAAKPPVAETVDPALAKAVESLADSKPSQPSGDGPPEAGILDPTKLEADLGPGGATKIVVGSTGQKPRRVWASWPDKAQQLPASVDVQVRTGAQGVLPMKAALSLKLSPSRAAEPGTILEPPRLKATLGEISASPSAPALSGQGLQALNALQKSVISLDLGSGIPGTPTQVEVAQGAPQDLQSVLGSVAEALDLLLVPFPSEPLGSGAYFMVTSRDRASELDVVTYRMVRLTSASASEAKASVTLRQYAAGPRAQSQSLAGGAELSIVRLQSEGQGELELAAGLPLPATAQMQNAMMALLARGTEQSRPMALQSQLSARFELEADAPGQGSPAAPESPAAMATAPAAAPAPAATPAPPAAATTSPSPPAAAAPTTASAPAAAPTR